MSVVLGDGRVALASKLSGKQWSSKHDDGDNGEDDGDETGDAEDDDGGVKLSSMLIALLLFLWLLFVVLLMLLFNVRLKDRRENNDNAVDVDDEPDKILIFSRVKFYFVSFWLCVRYSRSRLRTRFVLRSLQRQLHQLVL